MASFSKFVRPETPSRGIITGHSLDIIQTVLRHRFTPTSELVRLVEGNQDVIQRNLRKLWEWHLLNRFAFPGFRTYSEFIYYLDRREALELLVRHGRLNEIHPQMEHELRMNREADYAGAAARGQHMKLGFLQHSLMISRMHFMLEMAARGSGGKVHLIDWRQGSALKSHVLVPRIKSVRDQGNTYRWHEADHSERLPVEPDALFTLRFGDDDKIAHFCYEADRGTMTPSDMLRKFRAYYHFIKKQQKHKDAFGVHPVRAVLVETTDEARATKLMKLVHHPLVYGPTARSALFWFTISPLFAGPGIANKVPTCQARPQILLDRIWALPDRSIHALTDT